MGDSEFCDFVLTLQPLILSSDIEGMLRYAHYDICMPIEGWVDCKGETYCLWLGMLAGDGGCKPISTVKYFWDGYAVPPLVITGVVYPFLPYLGLEGKRELSGPVILVKTGDDEFDLLIFCQEYDDLWFISALLLQNETAADYLTPPQIIVTWP